MKRALAIRHVAFEDLGILSGLLRACGYVPAYRAAGIDPLDDIQLGGDDLLIVLGGPIGAYEEERYPFLIDELRVIERCLQSDVPVLGICLGAQLLARALGARVYPGAAREIGFAPIKLTADGRSSCLRHLDSAGSHRLASTEITPNQAFSAGSNVLALQFHIEDRASREVKRIAMPMQHIDQAQFERWLIGHACELAGAKVDIPTLRGRAREHGRELAKAATEALRDWLSRPHPSSTAP